MAFKKIMPNIKLASGASVCATVQRTIVDGSVTRVALAHRSFREAYPDRLPADNFSLDKQLQAGVNLKQINSEVLSDDVNLVELPDNSVVEPENSEE